MAEVRREPDHIEATLEELAHLAKQRAQSGRHLLGITGSPGAGKSTVCHALAKELGSLCAVVPMDGFHLDNPVLEALGARSRKGAADTFDVEGYVSLLERVRNQSTETIYAPRFDRSVELAIGSAIPVHRSANLILTEGNYLLESDFGWEQVRPLLDEIWFLDISDAERQRRLVERRKADGEAEEAARQWVESVDEANAQAIQGHKHMADLVIQLV